MKRIALLVVAGLLVGATAAHATSGRSNHSTRTPATAAQVSTGTFATAPATSGADDPATHEAGDDNGADDPTTHEAGDDSGADDPSAHEADDDSVGNSGPSGNSGASSHSGSSDDGGNDDGGPGQD